MSHIPVLRDEVLSQIMPLGADDIVIDATFGAGGYSREILNAFDGQLVALDRDPSVQRFAEALAVDFPSRFKWRCMPFSQMAQLNDELEARGRIAAIVLDIGVSSMQIDQAARGFSFQKDGPLDMRMAGDADGGPSAADAVNFLSQAELTHIFRRFGEEKRARRCAEKIVELRAGSPIETTARLAEIIEGAIGRGGKKHPATRVFQALRIYVNDELGELERALSAAEAMLPDGGHLVVVTFHSLEDRIVKKFMRARAGKTSAGSRHAPPVDDDLTAPSFALGRYFGDGPSEREIARNPRARSSRIRAAVRTNAPAWPAQIDTDPRIVPLRQLRRRAA